MHATMTCTDGKIGQVDRYLFFPADAQRFRSGTSLLERGLEESEAEGQLSTALRVLTQLHERMFSASSPGEPLGIGDCFDTVSELQV